ncbi:aminoglycoside 6'-N-acetyltransferase [Nocardioides daedukensis]|uniref:Aminoglycoside 6'-N-acetyltransferase n=1 Tax=Nocardioides daedukensis TaxID=634462 RepID=A0A7Y9RWA7_9ACTN|nr:GNAT family protein [Nocardioides daedukensis]NYG57847.1 aminoglycoside 6'-N-acetyltransferase [Nocardioides daedukensis]
MRALDLPVRTERLVLRAHRTDDLAALMSYYSDPEVTRYLPWAPWTRQDAELALAKRISRVAIDTPDSALSLVVERGGQVIGDVVLWPADDTLLLGELGWALHPSARGCGYACESVSALISLAFGHYGMRRVRAGLDPRNAASAALCRSLGMKLEGHLREDRRYKDEWVDSLVFGLLSHEWQYTDEITEPIEAGR